MTGEQDDRTWQKWRAEIRATLLLAWPLVLTNVTQAGIQTTDVVMLGWAGPEPLAASALGASLYTVFLVFGVGVATAAAPLVARELGRRFNSVRDARRTVRQGMWATAILTVPVWILLWNSEPVFRLLGQQPGLSEATAAYLRALQWGLMPALWLVVLRSFVSALERPIWSLVVSCAGLPLNAFLNYGLIFGNFGLPELGVVGAGVASSITNVAMFATMASIVTNNRRFRRFNLFGRFWRPDWPRFIHVWTLGAPIGITFALEVGVFSAAVVLMGLISLEAVAAHAIAIQVAALTFMVPMGIGQAVTVRVGLASGRRDKAAVTRAGWTSFGLGVGFMAMMALMIVAFPHPLVHLFLDESDPANARVIPLAVSFLMIAALFQIVDGAQAVGAGMLRGLQDTTVPMIYAVVGYWLIAFGIGAGLAFGAGWGGIGIWTGLASGLAIVAVLMVTRWIRRERLGLT